MYLCLWPNGVWKDLYHGNVHFTSFYLVQPDSNLNYMIPYHCHIFAMLKLSSLHPRWKNYSCNKFVTLELLCLLNGDGVLIQAYNIK